MKRDRKREEISRYKNLHGFYRVVPVIKFLSVQRYLSKLIANYNIQCDTRDRNKRKKEEKRSANIYLPIFTRHSNPVHSSHGVGSRERY